MEYFCPKCSKNRLLWKQFHGFMLSKEVGRTTYYQAKCDCCGEMNISKTQIHRLRKYKVDSNPAKP